MTTNEKKILNANSYQKAVNLLFDSPERALIEQALQNYVEDVPTSALQKEIISYHLGLQQSQNKSLSHSKRLRSYLAMNFASGSGLSINEFAPVAAAIELIHTATLIIDDIQDESQTRHDKESVWMKFGQKLALNTALQIAYTCLLYTSDAADE